MKWLMIGSLILFSAAVLWKHPDFDIADHTKTNDSSSISLEEAGTIELPDPTDLTKLRLSLVESKLPNEQSADSQLLDEGIPNTVGITLRLTEAENAIMQQQSVFRTDLIELSENVQNQQLQDKLSNSLASATNYREMILQKAKSQNILEELNR